MADNGPTVRDHLQLLGKFLRHPRTVGAVAPSSAALAREMVTGVGEGEAERIVELGPGTGSFTRAIVGRLGPRGRLLAVDVDAGFVEGIRRRWPAVDCVCASAEALPELAATRGFLPVNRIISGLPFASLPEAITRRILDGIERTLRPTGTFTTFQYRSRLPLAASDRVSPRTDATDGGPAQGKTRDAERAASLGADLAPAASMLG